MELLHAFSTNSTVCSLTARTSPSYTAGGAIHAAWGRLHWARCWVTTLWFFNIFNIPNGLQYISCLHTWSFDFLVQQAAELFFHFRHKGLTLNSPHVYVYLFIYTLTVILAYNFFFIYIFKIPWNTDSFLWIYLHSDHFFFSNLDYPLLLFTELLYLFQLYYIWAQLQLNGQNTQPLTHTHTRVCTSVSEEIRLFI